MDLALYHPRHGFYTKGPIIGRPNGQFNTNAMYHAFAFTLYLAIQQAEDTLGEQLRIVEFGGGTLQPISSPTSHPLETTSLWKRAPR